MKCILILCNNNALLSFLCYVTCEKKGRLLLHYFSTKWVLISGQPPGLRSEANAEVP